MSEHTMGKMRVKERTRLPVAPGPQGMPVFGSLPLLLRQGIYRLVLDTWQQFGSPFRLRLGPQTITFLVDPVQIAAMVAHQRHLPKGRGYADLRQSVLGEGLLASDGERWRQDRRLLQPLFSHQAVTGVAGAMVEAAEELATRWHPLAASGAPALDILEEMQRLTQHIILRCLFSQDAGARLEELGADFTTVLTYISQLGSGAGLLNQLLPTPTKRRYQAASTRLVTFAARLLCERRSQEVRPDDVLTRLLDALATTDHHLSDQHIIAHLLTLWFAGHETQTLVLAWAWMELATHPEAERTLHQELATVLNGRAPTLSDLPRLVYTMMLFKETLRLHPPALVFPREVTKALNIDGFRLEEGTLIMACPYLTHRLPTHWPDPEEFRPERFAPTNDTSHAPYAYYPFGVGQRTCIGQSFATQEFLLALAVLAQQFQLRPRAGFVPHLHAAGTLRLRNGMPMTLHPRTALTAPEARLRARSAHAYPLYASHEGE